MGSVLLVRAGERREVRIENAVPHAAGWRLSFSGISDPETAKTLAGAWICIPQGDATRPAEGWIEADLVDLPVFDRGGELLGHGLGLADLPTLSVRTRSTAGAEVVLPLEGPLACSILPASRRIEVDREVWEALS